ncbi:MAG: hypothetical protein QMB54_03170, partial [Neofamilia sp.]
MSEDKKLLEDAELEKGKKLLAEEAITSPSKMAFKNFLNNKLGMIGTFGFLLIVIIVFIGSTFLKYDAYYSQGVMKNIAPGSGYMKYPDELVKEGIKQISVGTTFSVGVSEAGNVYTWGHEIAKKQPMPQEVIDNQGNIEQVAAGDNHIIVLTKDGEVFGWGENNHGQS